ncbi:hypothetical protein ACP70R_020330 [Stipagrostis hirtigluma subsp. patula]
MDVEDVYDWLIWGLLAFTFLLMVLVAAGLLVMAVAQVVYICLRRRRRGGHSTPLPPSPDLEKLLESIPDVPYQELPGAGGAAEAEAESCVICVAAYEAGERCSVLPGCAHVFHTACIATWLRKGGATSCPLCRAKVGLLPNRSEQSNPAENMV